MTRDFGRHQRRTLRRLTDLAWERELSTELLSLAVCFDEWKAGTLGPHELSDRIHKFHHGAAREQYGLYTRAHPSQLVARAVGLGVLAESDVPAAVLVELARSIEYYRTELQPPLDDDTSTSNE
jgi:hypothetical protein